MGRWTQYDEDEYRLPEGMVRTGYDADTGQYYFSDRRSGTTYVGAPGEEFGTMCAPEATVDALYDRSKSTKRRATFSAFQSLKRSLTTARVRWRREQGPTASHTTSESEEEPVLASRPSSAGWDESSFRISESSSFISESRSFVQPEEAASDTNWTTTRRSAVHTPWSPGDSRRAASEHIHSTTASGRFLPIEKYTATAPAAPPVSKSVDAATDSRSTTESSSLTKSVSVSVVLKPQRNSRHAASEHGGISSLGCASSRVPRVVEEGNIEKHGSSVAIDSSAPVATGTATRSQKVRRAASEQRSERYGAPRTSAGVPGS